MSVNATNAATKGIGSPKWGTDPQVYEFTWYARGAHSTPDKAFGVFVRETDPGEEKGTLEGEKQYVCEVFTHWGEMALTAGLLVLLLPVAGALLTAHVMKDQRYLGLLAVSVAGVALLGGAVKYGRRLLVLEVYDTLAAAKSARVVGQVRSLNA
jgi:hypothetical protein